MSRTCSASGGWTGSRRGIATVRALQPPVRQVQPERKESARRSAGGRSPELKASSAWGEMAIHATEPRVQRTCAACAAGALCPSCRRELELEADGASAGAAIIRRAERGTGHTGGSPPAAPSGDSGSVVPSGGSPLSTPLRQFFEPAFGQPFADVRVHTGASAAEAAGRLDARAFTYGKDIVFDRGEWSPDSLSGRHLIAHELTHVLQQRGGRVQRKTLSVTPPSDPSELEADRVAGQIMNGGVGTERPTSRVSYTPVQVARRGAAPAVRPPPARLPTVRIPPPRAGTGASGRPAPTDVPYYQLYAPPQRHDMSLHALQWRASLGADRETARARLERPTATLERGGAAPSFVTPDKPQQHMGEWGTITVTPRSFHVLDAIESLVARATTPEQILLIYRSYLPPDLTLHLLYGAELDFFGPMRRGPSLPGSVFDPWVVYPADLDPSGLVRRHFFIAAARRRIREVEALRETSLARVLEVNQDYVLEGKERKEGPCRVKELDRFKYGGSNVRHNVYGLAVTKGNPNELQIETPEGIVCQTDGADRSNPRVVWEVKTRHEWTGDQRLFYRMDDPRLIERALALDWQRAKCLYVTNRCGYQYRYAFDVCETALAMRTQWGNVPPVHHIPFPGEPRVPCDEVTPADWSELE